MARRRKLTVFARFLIVLVILLPLAYVGASLLNDEDPIENVENFWRTITGNEPPEASPAPVEALPAEKPANGQTASPAAAADSAEQPAKPDPTPAGDAGLAERIQQLEAQQKALEKKVADQEQKIRWLESQMESMQ